MSEERRESHTNVQFDIFGNKARLIDQMAFEVKQKEGRGRIAATRVVVPIIDFVIDNNLLRPILEGIGLLDPTPEGKRAWQILRRALDEIKKAS
jgi:hypothetical protein